MQIQKFYQVIEDICHGSLNTDSAIFIQLLNMIDMWDMLPNYSRRILSPGLCLYGIFFTLKTVGFPASHLKEP